MPDSSAQPPATSSVEPPPPAELRAYRDLLLAELETVAAARTDAGGGVDQTASGPSVAEYRSQPLTWANVYSLHRRIIRLYDLPRLKRALWDIRDRYEDAFGPTAFADYMKSQPPDPALEATREDMLADLDQLLGRLYSRYSLSGFADASRKQIARKLVRAIIIATTILLVCFIAAWSTGSLGGSTMAAVIFAGTIGGFVSFIQRVQAISGGTDPLNGILVFQTTRFTFLYTSPLAGAVFAVVLYFSLLGQLISGVVFPNWYWPGKVRELQAETQRAQLSSEVARELSGSGAAGQPTEEASTPATEPTASGAEGQTPTEGSPVAAEQGAASPNRGLETPATDAKQPSVTPAASAKQPGASPPSIADQLLGDNPRVTLVRILSTAHPERPPDYALLLVWCFLAGFLERWVPDNLTRIANRGQSTETPAA